MYLIWRSYILPAASLLALRFFPMRLPREVLLPLFDTLSAIFGFLSTFTFFAGRSDVTESLLLSDDGRFLKL